MSDVQLPESSKDKEAGPSKPLLDEQRRPMLPRHPASGSGREQSLTSRGKGPGLRVKRYANGADRRESGSLGAGPPPQQLGAGRSRDAQLHNGGRDSGHVPTDGGRQRSTTYDRRDVGRRASQDLLQRLPQATQVLSTEDVGRVMYIF
jgi:hypothetical protein